MKRLASELRIFEVHNSDIKSGSMEPRECLKAMIYGLLFSLIIICLDPRRFSKAKAIEWTTQALWIVANK